MNDFEKKEREREGEQIYTFTEAVGNTTVQCRIEEFV